MIQELIYENIRGNSRTLKFYPRTTLLGSNGIGKSSIADAIAFAFTGCTASGKSAPIEMISDGQDKLTVKVVTAKSTIERTLTRKKTSHIKLTPNGKTTLTMNQEQLSSLSCSIDAFLSSFNVGFFMSISNERRMSVLREFTPQTDKFSLLEELIGEKLNENYRALIPITKRSDIAAASVSKNRRDLEKMISSNEGSLTILNSRQHPGEKPSAPESIEHLSAAKSAWDKYKDQINKNKSKELQNENIKNGNLKIEERIQDLNIQLNGLGITEEPAKAVIDEKMETYSKTITELKKSLILAPACPVCMSLPDSHNCPTCGQIVGSKHRETIDSMNKQALEDYKNQKAEVNKNNEGINLLLQEVLDKQKELLKEYDAAKEEWRNYCNKRTAIEVLIQKSKASLKGLNEIPEEPTPPPFAEVSDEIIKNAIEVYSSQKSKMDFWLKQMNTYNADLQKIHEIQVSKENLENQVKFLKKIEESLMMIDQRIFEINSKYYELNDGYRFVISEDVVSVISSDGRSYDSMSVGEKLRANARISEKIANSLPRKVKCMFIDNYDLSSEQIDLDIEQIFFAEVSKDNHGTNELYVVNKPIL